MQEMIEQKKKKLFYVYVLIIRYSNSENVKFLNGILSEGLPGF